MNYLSKFASTLAGGPAKQGAAGSAEGAADPAADIFYTVAKQTDYRILITVLAIFSLVFVWGKVLRYAPKFKRRFNQG